MATISPVVLLTATTEGSSTTTPRPRTAMIVLADPMSIAIESETRLRSASKPINARVFRMKEPDLITTEPAKNRRIRIRKGREYDSTAAPPPARDDEAGRTLRAGGARDARSFPVCNTLFSPR
jgi:hypothetical protein